MTISNTTISASYNLSSQQVTRDHQSDRVDRLSKLTTPILQMIFGYLCPQNSVAELPKIFPKEYGAKEKETQEKELNHLCSQLLAGGGIAAIRYRELSRHFNKSFGDEWFRKWSSGIVSAMPMNYDIMQQMVSSKCVTLFQIYILAHPKTLGKKTDGCSLFRVAVINGGDPSLVRFFLNVIQKKRLWGVLFDGLSPIVDWNQDGIRVIEQRESELRKKSPRVAIEILNKKLAGRDARLDLDAEYPNISIARSIKVYKNQIAIDKFMRRTPFKVRFKSFGIRILRKIINIALMIFIFFGPLLAVTTLVPSIYISKILNHISQGRMTAKVRKVCSYILGFIFSPIITPPILLAHSCFVVRKSMLDRTQLHSTIKKILMIPLGIVIFPIAWPLAALDVIDNR